MALDSSYSEPDQVLTKDDWLDAYNVQSACNLSGVVHSFAAMMVKILAESRVHNKGTDWANRHPIAILFADKVASLTGTQGGDFTIVFDAYDIQRKKVKQDVP